MIRGEHEWFVRAEFMTAADLGPTVKNMLETEIDPEPGNIIANGEFFNFFHQAGFRKSGNSGDRPLRPESGHDQSGYDMPDTPPGSNKSHAAEIEVRRKYFRIKNQDQSECGILDTCFQTDGTDIF